MSERVYRTKVKTISCGDCKALIAYSGRGHRFCSTCIKERNRARCRAYRAAHPEQTKKYNSKFWKDHPHYKTQWRERHADRLIVQAREYRERTKDHRITYGRAYTLAKKYGISVEKYEAIKNGQGGLCANPRCRSDGTYHRNGLVVDHCHATGKVRRLLCNGCNIALGGVRENANIAMGLIDLLREYEAMP